MKIYLFFFILFLFACNSNGDKDILIVGSADKMNVLRTGVENPVEIAVSGIPSNKIIAKIDTNNGSIKGDNGRYVVKVKNKKFRIDVYKKEEDKEIFIDSMKFRIKGIPPPEVAFGPVTREGGILEKRFLHQVKEIELNWGGIDFDLNIPIVYYVMTIPVNNQFLSIEEDGPKINDMMKKYLNEIKPGQKIIIEDVTIRTPEGDRRKIKGLILTVR